jgi:hypothetical protein
MSSAQRSVVVRPPGTQTGNLMIKSPLAPLGTRTESAGFGAAVADGFGAIDAAFEVGDGGVGSSR